MESGMQRRARLEWARLYLVCGLRPDGRELADVLRAALAGGVDVFQLRDKEASGEELLAVTPELRALCDDAEALFVLNDRPSLVEATGADGVHLGQDDMPVAEARALAGDEVLIGLSTHTPAQVDAARGVDYIGVGPVHSTPTKPGRPAVGSDLVAHAAAHATVPFFAIGGIAAHNVQAVVAAGARRIAVVRAIAHAPDPEGAAAQLRAPLDAAVEDEVRRGIA